MNWLETYDLYTSKLESPSIYHFWTGVSTIASALERKVWTPLMFDKIYPNMYIILVGPAGRCRKGSAMAMGTRLLRELDKVNLCANIITRQALIKSLVKKVNSFEYNGETIYHSSTSAISPELDVVISSDRIEMLRMFTDIFDSQHHDKYEMETISRKLESIQGLWFHLFGATVPEFFRSKEMAASVSGGFTSRCIFIYAHDRRFRSKIHISDKEKKKIQDKQDKKYFSVLADSLKKIHSLVGPFHFTDEAGELWNEWYQNLADNTNMIAPLQPYWERKHVHALKLAMCLAVSENQNELVIRQHHIVNALGQLKEAEKKMHLVFSGTGRSVSAKDIDHIWRYVERKTRVREKDTKQRWVSKGTIYNDNWRDVETNLIDEILITLSSKDKLGVIEKRRNKAGVDFYRWKEGKEEKEKDRKG